MAEQEKRTYDAPRALRVGAMATGQGDCDPSGSGEMYGCYGPGTSASARGCVLPGSAAVYCQETGNSPTIEMTCAPGSQAVASLCTGPGSSATG